MPAAEASWPTELPLPEMATASLQTVDTHEIFETNDFDPIRQYRWKLFPSEFSCELLLPSGGAWAGFENFYKLTLRYGNAWFSMPLAVGGGMRNCLCAFNGGYTVTQISSPIRYPTIQIGYRINFTLLVYQPEQRKPEWL